MVRFPNPPLKDIDHTDLLTDTQAGAEFRVEPQTIRRWERIGLIEPVDLGPGGPKLYHYDALAEAEHFTWRNGANRPMRGGRMPGWKPCQSAA